MSITIPFISLKKVINRKMSVMSVVYLLYKN